MASHTPSGHTQPLDRWLTDAHAPPTTTPPDTPSWTSTLAPRSNATPQVTIGVAPGRGCATLGRHGGGVSRRVRGETHPPYPPRVSNPSPNTTTTNARVLDLRVCRHVKMLGWAVRARRRECAGRRASGWCSLCALVGVSFRKLTEPTPTPVFLRKDKRVPCAKQLTPIPIAPGWLVVMWGAERRRWWAEKTQAAQEVVLVRAAARTCVRPRVCRRMVARGTAGPPKKRRLSAPQPSQERSAPRLKHSRKPLPFRKGLHLFPA